MTQQDKTVIRELAKQYMEIACSEKQQKAVERMRATNDLKIVRPPVIMDEIPWYQMNIGDELTCLCSEEKARRLELTLRKGIYRHRHFKCDAILEPCYKVRMHYDATPFEPEVQEQILRTDGQNNIVSHYYGDLLETEESVEKLQIPTFTARPDQDEAEMNYFSELLGDVMPVKLCGRNCLYHAPWDRIACLRGVEPILMDLYDRPEHLHRIRRKFHEAALAEMDFVEKHLHVDPDVTSLHCTPGYISGLAEDGWKATWFRGMAQMFSDVSPQMLEEFDIDYSKELAERFAYSYYGCCEALDRRMDVVKKLPNLRKIGVSPWSDEEMSARAIGGNYVYARKPNPANVAIQTDPKVIRAETEKTVKLCQKFSCPVEFVLKDISTVSNRPENLILWAETVSDVLDEYYGT